MDWVADQAGAVAVVDIGEEDRAVLQRQEASHRTGADKADSHAVAEEDKSNRQVERVERFSVDVVLPS